MFLVTIILLVLGFFLYVYHRLKLTDYYQKYKSFYKIPSPFYVPFIGSTYLFIGRNMLNVMLALFTNYGNRSVIYIPHTTYVTCDPEEIGIILNNTIEKSKDYNHLKFTIEDSLLISKASLWKKNRKILSKSFKHNLLESFVPIFYKKSTVLLDILKKKNYGDLYKLLEKLTLDSFFETTLGIESSVLTEKENLLIKNLMESQRIMFSRMGNILKMNDFIFSLMEDGKFMKKTMESVRDFLEPIILQKKHMNLDDNDIFLSSSSLPLLELLVNSAEKENFTNDYIVKEIVLFAVAATDSSAFTIAYTLCLLGMNQDIQQKVYDEIISIVGDQEINIYNLNQLKYLDMVINETLRLLPVIPMILRQTTSDLDVGSCIIPKDTGILISILNLHRDENTYTDPLKFDPDRFLPENVAKRHPYSYLPFSAGPRNCIGWKYAQLSVKTALANILRSFLITAPYKSISEWKFESTAVMSTTHPLEINFISREKTENN